jgi:hypothetical protein
VSCRRRRSRWVWRDDAVLVEVAEQLLAIARISYCCFVLDYYARPVSRHTRSRSAAQRMHWVVGGVYLIPVRFHVYDAFSDLLALEYAPNMPQAPSFASRKRVWRHVMWVKSQLPCGIMHHGRRVVGHEQSFGKPRLETALHAPPPPRSTLMGYHHPILILTLCRNRSCL